jgi:hypothetical protein
MNGCSFLRLSPAPKAAILTTESLHLVSAMVFHKSLVSLVMMAFAAASSVAASVTPVARCGAPPPSQCNTGPTKCCRLQDDRFRRRRKGWAPSPTISSNSLWALLSPPRWIASTSSTGAVVSDRFFLNCVARRVLIYRAATIPPFAAKASPRVCSHCFVFGAVANLTMFKWPRQYCMHPDHRQCLKAVWCALNSSR